MTEVQVDQNTTIYHEVAGGSALVGWFGTVPSFGDAEILSLHLSRKGQSILRLHGWATTGSAGSDGSVSFRHAVVTFTFEDLLDLQLDGFSAQNVIGGLTLRRVLDRPERKGCVSNPLPQDIEVELEHCYGLAGWIRARSVSITFRPGEPNQHDA